MRIRQLLAVTLLAGSALAEAAQIVLQDGSSIQGSVLSMENGTYTIRTASLGVIRLDQGKIRSINQGGDTSAPVPPGSDAVGAGQSAVQSLQSSMVNDPGIMSSIMALQNDPDMQAVLQDPEVMRAVQSFDLETLRNHPKIRKLMQNQSVQRIQGTVN